jgi:hypothetical protein
VQSGLIPYDPNRSSTSPRCLTFRIGSADVQMAACGKRRSRGEFILPWARLLIEAGLGDISEVLRSVFLVATQVERHGYREIFTLSSNVKSAGPCCSDQWARYRYDPSF